MDDRLLIIADTTLDPVVNQCRKLAPHVQIDVAPYDRVMASLLNSADPIWHPAPTLVLVSTRLERLSAAYAAHLAGRGLDSQALARDVSTYADALKAAAPQAAQWLVTSWSPGLFRHEGVRSWNQGGTARALAQANLQLAESFDDTPSIHLFDTDALWRHAGANAYHSGMWYLAKLGCQGEAARALAAELVSVLQLQRGQRVKLIALDLDDTLWGGVVGDVGKNGIDLGPPSPTGEAFQDFQRQLKRLQQQGILLALVSKNTESIAMDAIANHPDMILRPEDFVSWRVNWQDKAANLEDIIREVNLGASSVLFLDDSAFERGRVRDALPDVRVPDLPDDPADRPLWLSSRRDLDSLQLTTEDSQRHTMMRAERERNQLRSQTSDFNDWLAELELSVALEPLSALSLARATQLINKTNQFNLAARKRSETDLATLASRSGGGVWVARVQDRFGDYGTVSVVSATWAAGDAEIQDWVMSCRVMGRHVEDEILNQLGQILCQHGVQQLRCLPAQTPRNGPLREALGRLMSHQEDGSYTRRLTSGTQEPDLKNPQAAIPSANVAGNGIQTIL